VRVTPQINIAVPLDLQIAAREALGLPDVNTGVLVRAALAHIAGVPAPVLRRGRAVGYKMGSTRTITVELPDA
jgi:hypothetical protein